MASEYAIKKANQREMLEQLDRGHHHEVNKKKNTHKQEMAELRARHSLDKKEYQGQSKNQIETLKQNNDSFVQTERLNHNDRVRKQELQAQQDYRQAAAKKVEESARLKQQAQIEKENLHQTRQQYREMTVDKKRMSEKQLEDLDKEGRFRLKQKNAQLNEHAETIQKSHNQEVQRVEQTGQEKVRDRKIKYNEMEIKQEESHKAHIEQEKQAFLTQQQQQEQQYNKKLDQEEQGFQDQLKNQRTEYTRRYDENERFNKASFSHQQNKLDEELFKLKKEFVSTQEFYEGRQQDPFYQLVDFGAEFEEGEAFYQVKAQVPEHEMKNVRVHIQPDKISLQAARNHQQEFKKENEKIGTNISQTIRQEFKMEKPADHEKAVKTYKDGTLTVTVPKRGYFTFNKL